MSAAHIQYPAPVAATHDRLPGALLPEPVGNRNSIPRTDQLHQLLSELLTPSYFRHQLFPPFPICRSTGHTCDPPVSRHDRLQKPDYRGTDQELWQSTPDNTSSPRPPPNRISQARTQPTPFLSVRLPARPGVASYRKTIVIRSTRLVLVILDERIL